MGHSIEVPVTPSVVQWAIAESGYSVEEIAQTLGVPPPVLNEWLTGRSKPNLTAARKLASKLHRPFAAFLLPDPPRSRPLAVEFRHPVGVQRELNPEERRFLRRAARFQEVLSWLTRELAIDKAQTPSASLDDLDDDPASVAATTRNLLGVSTVDQKEWPTPSVAFDEWREALERTGHLVFQFSLGKESCRGFSLWDDYAPVVAVNTAWNETARIFTLFHEMAHLITRTSSACVESVRTAPRTDPVERWCERFAADVLMPAHDVEATLRGNGWRPGLRVQDLGIPTRVARQYKVSLRAAVIRLIDLEVATWDLYDSIPPISDKKPRGGGGGGRDRTQIREDQFGDRVTSIFAAAVEHDVLSRSQAVEFLDIPDVSFDHLSKGRVAR
jgi:Zn-dependent peptidase ImmA (M78 family)/transcriptional regulator with XRE-family HTH domain